MFDLQVATILPTQFWVNWPFGSGEIQNTVDFQDGGYLGFPIGNIVVYFNLQVALIFHINYRVNWPLSSGEILITVDFQDGGHLVFPIENTRDVRNELLIVL